MVQFVSHSSQPFSNQRNLTILFDINPSLLFPEPYVQILEVNTHGVRSLAERRQAPMVPSTVLNVPAPEVIRAVATTVRTAASPLADHMAR